MGRSETHLPVADTVRFLQRQPPTDADSALAELTKGALRSVPGAEHAGITVATHRGKVHTASATDHYPSVLDMIQQRHHGGPCLLAAQESHAVRIDDLALEQRWPGYYRDAAAQTPIRSIMSLPLFATRHSMGALNFFAERPHAFDAEAMENGLVVATNTAVGWHMLCRDRQFRNALASRGIIGQAKGMLMERFGVDATQAFELLKRLSQGSNTKLVDVAHQMVEREHGHDDHH